MRQKKQKTSHRDPLFMSEKRFASFGNGYFAYVKKTTFQQACQMFPDMEGIPEGIDLYAICAADGTPLDLIDSRAAAIGRAFENELFAQTLQ